MFMRYILSVYRRLEWSFYSASLGEVIITYNAIIQSHGAKLSIKLFIYKYGPTYEETENNL
jgi:hypothetical protein